MAFPRNPSPTDTTTPLPLFPTARALNFYLLPKKRKKGKRGAELVPIPPRPISRITPTSSLLTIVIFIIAFFIIRRLGPL